MRGHHETLPTADLRQFHKNPRRGDVDAIATSLTVNGQYKPLIVNRGTHTGRPMEVLAGNHTLQAIRNLATTDAEQWGTIDCWIVDVDDDQASRIVLADNRTADLGDYDNTALLDLLGELEDDLDGTGYTAEDQRLIEDVLEFAPSLDELEDEYGAPLEEDMWQVIRLKVPPIIADQWQAWARGFETPEEAFEGLLDKGSDYTGG